MKRKLYLKLFFAHAVSIGLSFGTLFAMMGAVVGIVPEGPISTGQGALIGFLAGAIVAVPFGAVMAVITGAMHFAKTDSPYVRHRRTVFIGADHAEAMRLCQDAIWTVDRVRVKAINARRIEASKGLTWKSFGDRITCDVEPDGPDGQKVVIESRPWLRTTLVDYGSNLENVEAIVSRLEQNGGRLVIEQPSAAHEL